MSDNNDQQWRQRLSKLEYSVCREKGTEEPFSGEYCDHWQPGLYLCKCCQAQLFASDSKFDAGCGWPSFDAPLEENSIAESEDLSLGRVRTEVTCSHCGSHLGHLFQDGPTSTGLRYCINSASIDHKDKEE